MFFGLCDARPAPCQRLFIKDYVDTCHVSIDKKNRRQTARPRYCHAFDRTAHVPVSRFERASACVRVCAFAYASLAFLFSLQCKTRALTYLGIHAVSRANSKLICIFARVQTHNASIKPAAVLGRPRGGRQEDLEPNFFKFKGLGDVYTNKVIDNHL